MVIALWVIAMGESNMTKFRLLGAAALLSTVLAGPAMAQQVVSEPGYCAQFYPNANCQDKGPGNPFGNYQSPTPYRNDNRRGDNSPAYDNGGPRGGYDNSHAARNGFACQPGTWFKGEDGRRRICQ
jgi:hypothetical protein